MRINTGILRISLATAAVGAAGLLLAGDWPQWRGEHRDGISTETGLLQQWPAGGPKVIWKINGLGEGYSAFAISKGKLFTQGQRSGQQFVMAFDVATGKKLWETASSGNFPQDRGNGPRGTPTLDGTRIYAESGDGELLCLDQATGKLVWKLSLTKEFGGNIPHWGYSESPLVDGNLLIVTPGGRGASVVGLDKNTGKTIWKAQNDSAGYSSPIAIDAGPHQVVVFTAKGVMGLFGKTGELLWRYDRVANGTANIATPIFHDGHLFVSSAYGTGCALLKIDDGKATEVYFNRDMKNHYSSSVLVGDYLYGYSDAILTAMKLKTGEVAWRSRNVAKGSVAYADGKLYVLGEDGTVALVEATPSAYKEISRFDIQKGSLPAWTPPVISGGRLYLRDQDNLTSYDIKEK
ncbi:MAG: PQQ-binding-like beta-propeller repeat protein [Bryobacteraceae bacterium]